MNNESLRLKIGLIKPKVTFSNPKNKNIVMEVNNDLAKVKNRLLVKLCIGEISNHIDTVEKLFYHALFQLDSNFKSIFSSNEGAANKKFVNMMAIFKNAKHLDSIKESIEKLGERHALQYGAQIEQFPTLKNALLMALKQHLGDDFNAELEAAWSEVFDDVATIMQQAMTKCEPEKITIDLPNNKTEINNDLPKQIPLDAIEIEADLFEKIPLKTAETDTVLNTQVSKPVSNKIHQRFYKKLSRSTLRPQPSTHSNPLKKPEVFMIANKTNTYANLNLREQIYLECRAMSEYSLATGKIVPVCAIKHIEDMEDYSVPAEKNNGIPNIRKDIDITPLLNTHELLVRLIEPATPRTILLLDMEQRSDSVFKFLGAVSLIRQLMVATLISLFIFVALMASPFIDSDALAENVLEATGIEQLARLAFYISAAGLGAAFAALYKANSYISKGTYDPSYQSSYWIRFSLGIIAGLLLAILISEKSVQGEGMLSHGVVRPLLALLGGFSADLLYTFLNRMEETFKSLFESSAQNILDAKSIEATAKLAGLEMDGRMKLAQDLMQMQQQMSETTDPEEAKQQLNELLQNLMQPNRVRE